MHETPGSVSTLLRLFSGLAEQTFEVQLGVVDPPLVDYLSQMLARFVATDAIYAVRDLEGRRLDEVVSMLLEAQSRVGSAQREVHRHIGDFTLFWMGVFPEALPRMQRGGRLDQLLDYRQQGKRSYRIASLIETQADPPADVLVRLADQFELCEIGLREIRREWERRDGDPEMPRPIFLN